MPNLANRLGIMALLMSGLALLLVTEVIRPFRDLSIDGPIALACWGVGLTLALAALLRRPRSLFLGVIALLANVIPLGLMLALLWVIGHSNFAWH